MQVEKLTKDKVETTDNHWYWCTT